MAASDPLQEYYAGGEERDRLGYGLGRVEFTRTVEVVLRTLPPPPATVADIGGGPGRYAQWLVEAGYSVVLRDPVPLHVDQVRTRLAGAVDAAVGDARELDLDDRSVDAVLLLGPLYHLDSEVDRQRALAEARRVVRPAGPVYVAAIARWAARIHGMLVERAHERYPVLLDRVDGVERTGVMDPVHVGSFCGYAHTPSQLRAEVVAAGLEVESLVSVESVATALGDLDDRLDDDRQRTFLLDTLRALESVPELLGSGPHLLATARRPVE